jgi:glycosyltransferase involved in cell wall biosynthesis
VPRLLAAADIHCQPNADPEAFGITFVEALHASLPVVTTAIGGACEIVDESCGILITPGDSNALAEALEILIKDKSKRLSLGSRGPARAEQLCGLDSRIRQLHDALAVHVAHDAAA